MTEKRFGMYQNTLYDDGNILNPFDAMKLLNHFDKENTKLKEENEQLKSELQGMEELLKSYRKTIEYDAELLADATKNGYLPPLENWKGDV